VRSAVAHRQYNRLLAAVLEHDPTHDDITVFVGRFKTALDDRALARKGITTAGSALSPAPIRTVWGEGRHPLCTCHVIKDLPHGIVQAVATARARLATSTPKLGRGRPSSTDKAARRLARTSTAMQQQIRAVFPDRLVFVTRRRTPAAYA